MAIKVAFIGLSSNGWAKGAHYPYFKDTKRYQIVAICNSSKQSSEAAIKAYSLDPATVKAYGSPEELAADASTFDLAVCSVRVDKHHAAIKPLIAQGKQCYVEWPLGKNLAEARDLQSVAAASGNPRTVVGLQSRRSPPVNKLRQLVADGAIGRVLSVTVVASASNMGQVDSQMPGMLLNDASIGASILSIHFGHLIDYVLYGVGADVKELSGILSTQRPKVQVKMDDGSVVDKNRETPDQILLQGRLGNGAVLSAHIRGGPPIKDGTGVRWHVYGETGEIELTAPAMFLQLSYDDAVLRLHKHEADTVETVEWAVKDEFEGLPAPARNIARVYEAFADGKREEYADWEEAVGRHLLLESIVKSSETGQSVSL